MPGGHADRGYGCSANRLDALDFALAGPSRPAFGLAHLAFLAFTGTAVTFLFGLAPALRASTISPNRRIEIGRRKTAARIGLFRPLIAAQTAFGFVVLFVAGLCLASFAKLVSNRSRV